MKKTVVAFLAFVLLLSAASCGSAPQTAAPFASAEESETDMHGERQKNSYLNDDREPVPGKVAIKPYDVIWESGLLIAHCYVINGTDGAVTEVNVKNLTFTDPEKDLASASFGVLKDVNLATGEARTWTFTFEDESVFVYGADLSELTCTYEIAFSQSES